MLIKYLKSTPWLDICYIDHGHMRIEEFPNVDWVRYTYYVFIGTKIS